MDMVSRSVRKFEAEKVRKSFHICGFDAMGKEVPRAELHSRLLEVMDVEEDGPLPEDPDSGDESDDPECAEIVSADEMSDDDHKHDSDWDEEESDEDDDF